jgi:hypothetical protein
MILDDSRDFSLCHHIHTASGTHADSCSVGSLTTCPELKCPELEADYSSAANAGINCLEALSPLHLCVFNHGAWAH